MSERRQFFLHIGVHKTGTTALQKFFHDNELALSQNGVHRLKTGLPADAGNSWGHHSLAWALRDGDVNSLWRLGAEEAESYSSNLVSSEEFAFIRAPSLYEPVLRVLAGFAIRPVCYLRRQDQLLESIYNHHVKSLGEVHSIMEFSRRVMPRLDYIKLLGCLSKSFGKEEIILRTFDPKYLQGDIFEDFLCSIGITEKAMFTKPTKTLNAGLTRDGLAKMLEINRKYAESPDNLRLARQVILREYQAAAWTEHSVLSEAERAELTEHFRAKNNEIAQQYFNRKFLF